MGIARFAVPGCLLKGGESGLLTSPKLVRCRLPPRYSDLCITIRAAAPNPAELWQLDPIDFPLNPQGDFSPPVPQGRRGEIVSRPRFHPNSKITLPTTPSTQQKTHIRSGAL